MSDEVKKYLHDIYTAILQIEEYLGDKRVFAAYKSNKMLKQAVERNVEIIGEAINQALKINAELPITSGRKIVNLRNLLIHSYDNIDDTRIWEIVIIHLPVLKSEVTELLKH
jgi:uncharacterized protein with HEPN domain